MVDSIINFLGIYAESYGYLTAFAFAFLENSVFVGLFLPGGIVVLLLGFYAAQGKLDPLTLVSILFVGTFLGNNLGYFLGYRFGRKVMIKISKVFPSEKDYFLLSENYYKKHGSKTVIWGRMIAMVGPFIPFTAGISKMNYTKFIVYDIAGAVLWSVWLTSLGYFFGANWRNIASFLGDLGVILLIFFAIIIYRYIRSQKNED